RRSHLRELLRVRPRCCRQIEDVLDQMSRLREQVTWRARQQQRDDDWQTHRYSSGDITVSSEVERGSLGSSAMAREIRGPAASGAEGWAAVAGEPERTETRRWSHTDRSLPCCGRTAAPSDRRDRRRR